MARINLISLFLELFKVLRDTWLVQQRLYGPYIDKKYAYNI